MSDGPLLVRRWSAMDAAARRRLVARGVDQILDPHLMTSVGELVDDVRQNGDVGVLRATERFDQVSLSTERLRVCRDEMAAAHASIDPVLLEGIRLGIANISAFNRHLIGERRWSAEIAPGVEVGERTTPIASAGLFVPCGKGSYPSVLMHIGTPAVVAGVARVAVVMPPMRGAGGVVDSAVLAVAHELGLTEVFRANGPAGVAALALGTETFPRMLKVLGPGSPPVQAAQILCQRYGCLTQMLLGPSESLIVADDSADVMRLAADLITEAEHGPDSASLLVTESFALVAEIQRELAAQLADLPEQRAEWARTSLGKNGGAIIVESAEQAATVANAFAPEHMQLAVREPEALLDSFQHAGEILIGQDTPMAVANFVLGVPASLPTGGFARVTSGVTVETFLKKTSVARTSAGALAALSPGAIALSEHEGFPAHAAALHRRLSRTSSATSGA